VKAAAVVVRWRGGEEVDRCLRSLLDHGGNRLARIVLVDSGSGDGGAERLAAEFPDIDVVALQENRSFAHAANAGVATTTDGLVFLLNPDTEIRKGCVETLVETLVGRPRTAGAAPLLINPDGSGQHRWQFRRLPSAFRLATGRPGSPAFSKLPAVTGAVPQPAAAAWMVRREVWQTLDGLDESFAPAWWEDVDFCARLAAALNDPSFPADEGFVVVPTARAIHVGGSSVRHLAEADFLAAYHANLLRYASRHHSKHSTLIRPALTCSLLGKVVVGRSRAAAVFEALRELGRSPND